MAKTIHNMTWFLLLIAILFCSTAEFFFLEISPSRFNPVTLLLLLGSCGLFLLKLSLILREKKIPNFMLVSQIIIVSMIALSLDFIYSLNYDLNHEFKNNPLIPINFENQNFESYRIYPHDVYDWNNIRSSYVQKEYKKFVEFHQDYNDPQKLLTGVMKFTASKDSLTKEQIVYLKVLLKNVTKEDVYKFNWGMFKSKDSLILRDILNKLKVLKERR